jgi:hypothetical protein
MMMLSDMAESDMLHDEPVPAHASMKSKSLMMTRNTPISDNSSTESKKIVNNNENISDEVLEEVMPMMFSMDSMMEDESVNEEMESLEFS